MNFSASGGFMEMVVTIIMPAATHTFNDCGNPPNWCLLLSVRIFLHLSGDFSFQCETAVSVLEKNPLKATLNKNQKLNCRYLPLHIFDKMLNFFDKSIREQFPIDVFFEERHPGGWFMTTAGQIRVSTDYQNHDGSDENLSTTPISENDSTGRAGGVEWPRSRRARIEEGGVHQVRRSDERRRTTPISGKV